MSGNNNQQPAHNQKENNPPAETGNASNPAPHDNSMEPAAGNQLLNERAEKYLRESASIEDMPDEQDWQEAEEELKKPGNEQDGAA